MFLCSWTRPNLSKPALTTENVGAGTAHEVMSGAYCNITLASQRRTANEHAIEKDGLFLTAFSQGALGRSAKEGTAVQTTKMMHGYLPTAARLEMCGGDKGGSVECTCGATLEWNDGKAAHLQNHMFACLDAPRSGLFVNGGLRLCDRWRSPRSSMAELTR